MFIITTKNAVQHNNNTLICLHNHCYININISRLTTAHLRFEATNIGTLLFQGFKCPVNQARVHELCINAFMKEFVIGIHNIISRLIPTCLWDFNFSRNINYTINTLFDCMPLNVFYYIIIHS